MRSAARATVVAALAIAVLAVATAAFAAKPGPGTSTGSGTVFAPNPVADLQNQSLTDQKDADYAALAPAYHRVVLTNLDGSGFLQGDYANIRSETGDPAYSPTNEFHYRRNDDRFEQVMAYYWVTEAQKYIQSLGFGTTLRPVNKESQDLRINQWGADNSFSWDKKDMIKLGKGGVDDAEDAEVILHELGHAIQDSQQTPFGYGFGFEARRDRRGLRRLLGRHGRRRARADSRSGLCRRLGLGLVHEHDAALPASRRPQPALPAERQPGERPCDGRIWSRALWEIRKALGHVMADTLILEGHFGQRDPTMRTLAESTVAAANRLYGASVASTVRDKFVERGIL